MENPVSGLFSDVKRELKNESGTIIEFDCILKEVYSISAEVTQFPIETGASVSDFSRLLPEKLAIDVIVSATPVGLKAGLGGLGVSLATTIGTLLSSKSGSKETSVTSLVAAALAVGTGSLIQSQLDVKNRVKSVWDKLYDSIKKRETYSVVTGFKVYENMVITLLSNVRNVEVGRDLNFSMEMQQVTVVSVGEPDLPIAASLSPWRDSGNVPTTPYYGPLPG